MFCSGSRANWRGPGGGERLVGATCRMPRATAASLCESVQGAPAKSRQSGWAPLLAPAQGLFLFSCLSWHALLSLPPALAPNSPDPIPSRTPVRSPERSFHYLHHPATHKLAYTTTLSHGPHATVPANRPRTCRHPAGRAQPSTRSDI